MNLYAKRSFRLATSPFLFSLIAVLSACGGGSNGSTGSTVPAPDATVIGWYVGATSVETTVKVGSNVQWKSTDGMTHTVTSGSMPSAFAELNVPASGVSSPMAFNTPGTFPYFCSIHGAKVENGTLTVTP
jgi:plastocyanin